MEWARHSCGVASPDGRGDTERGARAGINAAYSNSVGVWFT
jgi:hypothetical protein